MGNRIANLGQNDDFSGRVIRIHGQPYRFQRRLGRGGFGAVYSARAPNGANVAVKVIDLDRMPGRGPQLVTSYLNEVRHLQRLKQESRHVVAIYDFDFDPRTGLAYIVMELGGENLGSLIEKSHASSRGFRGPGNYTDPALRKDVFRQIVSIVATLTSNNLVHMDLKPDNLILFGRTFKIADLGISKKADMLGQPGVGTPLFSAPEVMQDRHGFNPYYGPKADIWSLGAILYYMTYGKPPLYRPNAAAPPPGQAPSRDPYLNDILRRTLTLSPHSRADINSVLRHPYATT